MTNTAQLFIPKKVKVGQRNRDDCYTGRLGYVVAQSLDGTWRKQGSWEDWRDKAIEALEFDNAPTEGFVLNRHGGGGRGWDSRNEFARVYDPRNFEFEISFSNLLFILNEGDCSRGKGLEGKFVYAWDRDKLVLLPVSSEDYRNSSEFTALKGKNIGVRDLKEGATYLTKKQENLVYLGRFDYFFQVGRWTPKSELNGKCRYFVFRDGDRFKFLSNIGSLAICTNEACHPDYAEYIQEWQKNPHASKPQCLFLKDWTDKERAFRNPHYHYSAYWYKEHTDGRYGQYHTTYNGKTDSIVSVTLNYYVSMEKGVLIQSETHAYRAICYSKEYRESEAAKRSQCGYYNVYAYQDSIEWVEPTGQSLWVRLENGNEFSYSDTRFSK